MDFIQGGFTGFEIKNRQLTCWGRVSEVRTHVRPLESLDQVVADRMGWAGCRFPWTPLIYLEFEEYIGKISFN